LIKIRSTATIPFRWFQCIDTINQFLSENSADFVLIVAGYADAIRDNFFAVNSGLERRYAETFYMLSRLIWYNRKRLNTIFFTRSFPFRYDIGEYTAHELKEIFIRQVTTEGWTVQPDCVPASIFAEKESFGNMGGDCANLFMKVKLAHAHRIFLSSPGKSNARALSADDVLAGLVQHKAQYVKEVDTMWNEVKHMYGA
jgi:hypothetical protein